MGAGSLGLGHEEGDRVRREMSVEPLKVPLRRQSRRTPIYRFNSSEKHEVTMMEDEILKHFYAYAWKNPEVRHEPQVRFYTLIRS